MSFESSFKSKYTWLGWVFFFVWVRAHGARRRLKSRGKQQKARRSDERWTNQGRRLSLMRRAWGHPSAGRRRWCRWAPASSGNRRPRHGFLLLRRSVRLLFTFPLRWHANSYANSRPDERSLGTDDNLSTGSSAFISVSAHVHPSHDGPSAKPPASGWWSQSERAQRTEKNTNPFRPAVFEAPVSFASLLPASRRTRSFLPPTLARPRLASCETADQLLGKLAPPRPLLDY